MKVVFGLIVVFMVGAVVAGIFASHEATRWLQTSLRSATTR
jgi:hypothetical protein